MEPAGNQATGIGPVRLAIAALVGRPANTREVYRSAFALTCLVHPLMQVIEHGYGRCGVEVERGRYQRWLMCHAPPKAMYLRHRCVISLKGPPREGLVEEEPERAG
jgi:hypothetical protein